MAVIFDLEATCEENKKDYISEIIEIGAIKTNGQEFQAFIKPVINPILSEFCLGLTHIKQSDVDNAKLCKDVLLEFKSWVGNDTLYSWGDYDKNMINRELLRNNLLWDFRHFNLKKHYAAVKDIKPCGVTSALNNEGLKFDGTLHRGIDDARNIIKIYNIINERYGWKHVNNSKNNSYRKTNY